MKTNRLLLLLVLTMFSVATFAQGTVKGVVKDASSKLPLIGATVIVEGTTTGTAADMNGEFSFEVPAGSQSLVVSYVGYDPLTLQVNVENGKVANVGTVQLSASAIGLAGVTIIADYAKERETPVAISNITKKELEDRLGSRDIPLIMNNTPSVYATPQGGGAGDARINVRGFNQRNVAIMINGVPVNDMENGWVYWSNWDGIADATSSIQMQRGLSAVNLATPSIGGTMNIITSPAEMKRSASLRAEAGSGGFIKTTLSAHTGLINSKFAMSVSAVKKTGNGVIDGTWTDAWAYYLGASYNINKNHRLEVYAMGAPQRHGQNLYKQNVAAYDHKYAKELGVNDSTLLAYPQAADGRLYNENVSSVSESYTGQQWWNGKKHDRFAKDFINERENYYHKPLANLNWYAQWSEKVTQFTTIYYSGGKGGGTGTYGSLKWNYDGPSRIVDYDKTIVNNTTSDTAFGILRNSVNEQWTIGGISKFKIKFNERFQAQVGVDWRTAEIKHFREVRDLLGGKFFYYDGNDFESGNQYNKVLGDKIAYNFTNTVDWIGGFGQVEYTTDLLSFYGTGGYSMIKYTYVNHFAKGDDGGELKANTDWIGGYQLKGGLNYNATENVSIYGNVGLISKAPIFDNVISDRDGTVAADPENENFTAFEFGTVYSSDDDKFGAKLNFYNTAWANRTRNIGIVNEDGSEGYVFVKGMDQLHQGVELEFNYRPVNIFGIGGVASFANWKYTKDVSGTYKDYESGGAEDKDYNYYVKDLKVGDAPQTQFTVWANVYPVKGLNFQVVYRYCTNHYADWNPFSRTDKTDTEQVWKAPSYGVVDLHVNYQLPLKGNFGVTVFAHAFNLFDTFYIQDAVDDSRYNGFYGYDDRFKHTVNSAEVFLGLPFMINGGVKFTIY